MAEPSCAGCGKPAGEFQCPLCQAAELDGGFFCGQECFAKNFVEHRNAIHKSGTVKAKRSRAEKAREAEDANREKREKRKKALEGIQRPSSAAEADAAAADATAAEILDDAEEAFSDEEEQVAYKAALDKELAKRKELAPWPVWPGADVTGGAIAFTPSENKAEVKAPYAVIESPVGSSWTRSDVPTPEGDVEARLHSTALFAMQTAANWVSSQPHRTCVVVTGSATSCHAAAWAARCRSIQCVPVCSDDVEAPEEVLKPFTPAQRAIVIVSYPALGATDPTARVSAWLGACHTTAQKASPLLITLPDLPVPAEDIQSLSAPSIFLRPGAACDSKFLLQAPGAKKKVLPPFPVLDKEPALVAKDFEPVEARYSPEVSAALVARGDLLHAVNVIARVYTHNKTVGEDLLRAAVMADWGSDSVVHAHHRLAVLLRLLCDASVKLSTSTKVKDQMSLAYIAGRCVVRAAKHLAPLDESHEKAMKSPCPFIYLDATLAYCFSRVQKAAVDELAECWGIHRIGVVGSFTHADRLRAVAVHRLRSAHMPKLGVMQASFAVMLHHCIADACIRHTVNVADIRAATLWDWACAPYGDLATFLAAAQLVHKASDMTSASGYTREGVKTTRSQRNKKTYSDVSFVSEVTAVQQHPTQSCGKLKRLKWPLMAARQRRRDLMRRAALEELLSALPSSNNVPMYLGNIGNLIGKWTTFNSRFGGYLPASLLAFLEEHPEEFRIVGNIVTRVKASKTPQIKIRFDEDEYHGNSDSDSDGGRRKRNRAEEAKKKKISLKEIRTRRGLQAAEKKLLAQKGMTKRAAKGKLKSLRNKARFNRNQKKLDTSARVPGYNKPKAKAIKGRGRKANIRTTKRQ
uniref:C6H2-type domain-containing protein n=1 Tax=Neobodo designis TaxID=312471 RepID=A0A7S1LQM9_NEODS|mmetsp:Transcript_26627/g.82358  ORF Transcript_26627/g.82358 Transcript_26627/m.82358 type:complete len:862 (+) Transcript_26627:49-2634(+)